MDHIRRSQTHASTEVTIGPQKFQSGICVARTFLSAELRSRTPQLCIPRWIAWFLVTRLFLGSQQESLLFHIFPTAIPILLYSPQRVLP
jgi:hypothetical protein